MSNYTRFPDPASGIKIYPSVINFPVNPGKDGVQAVAADTNTIYIFDTTTSSWQAVANPGAAIAIDGLNGDVSATGPGVVSATVNSVGGSSAGDINTSVLDTQAATDLSTVSTLVKRDASGQTSLDGLNLDGSVSGAISIQAANTTTGYTVKMPAAQGAASTYLQNDGSGNLSWASISLLPSQTGNLDKVLVTDGTSASWQYAGLGAGSLGTNNVVVGRSKPASMAGTDNTVIGAGAATALIGANRVVCIGSGSGTLITSGNQSVVIGAYASSPSTSAFNVVVGDGASCSSSDSIAIGKSASASNQYGIAIGDLTVAASRTVSVGSRISGGGTFSVAVGKDISNSGASSIVFGHGASDRGESNVLAIGSINSGVINTVYLGLGAAYQTSANAVKIMTMRASGTTDTNMSAGALTLAASQGTGTGAGGDVIISTAPAAGVTGSTTNAHVERIRAKSAGEVVVNDTGVDFDFRVEGDNDANLVFVDASTDRVGIGTATPAQKLDVNGTAQATAFQVPNYILSPQLYNEGTKTGNFTLDFANGPCQQVTINAAGPLVITLSNPVTGGAYLIKIVQGATTGTVTWPAAVKWGTAGAPVLSTTTGLIDIINLYYDGTNYYGTYALGF